MTLTIKKDKDNDNDNEKDKDTDNENDKDKDKDNEEDKYKDRDIAGLNLHSETPFATVSIMDFGQDEEDLSLSYENACTFEKDRTMEKKEEQ